MQQTIKLLKNNKIKLNSLTYKPYLICELPANFGCIEFKEREGISEWFNYKGLTYILDN